MAFLVGEEEGKLLTEYVSSIILFYMNDKYIHEEHTVYIFYHIILCPKRRKKSAVGPVR